MSDDSALIALFHFLTLDRPALHGEGGADEPEGPGDQAHQFQAAAPDRHGIPGEEVHGGNDQGV